MSGGNLSTVYQFYTMAVTAATMVQVCITSIYIIFIKSFIFVLFSIVFLKNPKIQGM